MKKITLILLLIITSFSYGQEANYTLKNIKANTTYSDFGPSYYGTNEVIFASSRRDLSIRKRVWINKQPYLDLYKGDVQNNGELENIRRFSKKINSKFHESNVAFTKDLKTVYFTRDNYLNRKVKKDSVGVILNQLYKAAVDEKGKWSNIEPMPFNDDNYQTGHPTLNKDETKLYFISDMPGGYGATDIYVVAINTDGTYGEPKNLGPIINTSKKEMFPYIDENDVLYYASDGFPDSKGGLDIYASKLVGNYAKKPQNLGFPINSNKDDFALVKQKGGANGYFSSNRKGGKGDDDIYAFTELRPLNFDCTQEFVGVVRNQNTGALLSDAIVTLYKGNAKVESVQVGSNAQFNFSGDCKSPYKLEATKKNFKENAKNFTSHESIADMPNLDLTLKPSEFITLRGKLMININPIYFDLDKYNIRKDAAIELERVLNIMNKYPSLVIQIGSYTDSRAPDNYNWVLSNKRAVSTMNWLIDHGIDKRRIFGSGYGETKLVNKCSNGVKCTEAEHQKNRRTEFVIVNPGVINE